MERVLKHPSEVSADSGLSSRFGSGARPTGSLTNAIADLCLDISQYWNDLHPTVQERIHQRFEVDSTPEGIKVTLR